jgi:hypothetical protein
VQRVRRQADELLKLAADDADRRIQIERARDDLLAAMGEREFERRLDAARRQRQVLLDLDAQARSEQLAAQGRIFDARLEQIRRAHEREMEAARGNAAQRVLIEHRTRIQLVQLAVQARDAILTIDRQLYDERTRLVQSLLSLEERIAQIRIDAVKRTQAAMEPGTQAFDAAQKRIQAINDQLQRMREDALRWQVDVLERSKAALDPAFDADRIRQINQELSQLFQQQALTRADELRRRAAERFQDMQRFLDEFRPDLAEIARRQGEALEQQALLELQRAQDRMRALGEESIRILANQRDQRLGEFRRVFQSFADISGTATKLIGDQFTALGQHIVTSISDGVREAAKQIEALTGRKIVLPEPATISGFMPPAAQPMTVAPPPPPPPTTSPALPRSTAEGRATGGGRVVVVQGDLRIDLTVPEWVTTPAQLEEFIREAMRRLIERELQHQP